jgi:hypothetical protein
MAVLSHAQARTARQQQQQHHHSKPARTCPHPCYYLPGTSRVMPMVTTMMALQLWLWQHVWQEFECAALFVKELVCTSSIFKNLEW